MGTRSCPESRSFPSRGLWFEQTKGTELWMNDVSDLKSHSDEDMLFAVVDEPKDLLEEIGAVYLTTTIQACIVHLIRNFLDLARWKGRKAVAAARNAIYGARTAARATLGAFADGLRGVKSPPIGPLWRQRLAQVIPFVAFPLRYTARSDDEP